MNRFSVLLLVFRHVPVHTKNEDSESIEIIVSLGCQRKSSISLYGFDIGVMASQHLFLFSRNNFQDKGASVLLTVVQSWRAFSEQQGGCVLR